MPVFDEYNPSFSNNGKTIVHDVVSPWFHLLALTDVTTGQSVPLEGGDGGNDASWSPNGNFIAFDRIPYGDPSIYLLPPVAGDPYAGNSVLVREFGVDPEWSPNSQRLAFTDAWYGALMTINVNTGDETTLVDFGLNASWSPNGQFVAYTDGNNLFKIAVNNAGEPQGAPIQLTFDGPDAYNQQPSWSNNSKTIVFHSNRDNTVYDFDIWMVPAAGGTPTKLTGLAGTGEFDPAFSKDGQWVAYAGVAPPPMPLVSTPDAGILPVSPAADHFVLNQNYPNPFRESTVIGFELPETATVSVSIYNANGTLVKTLASDQYDKGAHQVVWDGTGQDGVSLPSGIYTCKLASGKFVQNRRMIRVGN